MLTHMQNAKGYICSYQKSGRTWLRFALASYLLQLHEVEFDLSLQNVYDVVPNLDPPRLETVFLFKECVDPDLFLCSQQPYQEELFANAPTVFLYRDPFDVLVSFYFYKTRHAQILQQDMTDFVGKEIAPLTHYLNSWASHIDDPNVFAISYEAMRRFTPITFCAMIKHLGLPEDNTFIQSAIEASSFDNSGTYSASWLAFSRRNSSCWLSVTLRSAASS